MIDDAPYRAFQSGFEPEPVMCQTVNMTMANQYCLWACTLFTNRLNKLFQYFSSSYLKLFFPPLLCAPLQASCGEWCLTKTSGFCPQMHATVRRNGTDIKLENCTRITETECKQVFSQIKLPKTIC